VLWCGTGGRAKAAALPSHSISAAIFLSLDGATDDAEK
jgi:hypothetical protein